jgi:CRP/FNR family transcriptional regulator, cyclic AMP receptor protein
MISPEILRRYPFFAHLDEEELAQIAMISEESSFEKGDTIFKEGQKADSLYLLEEGSVDLFYHTQEEHDPRSIRKFLVGEINPGEVFAISVFIDPFILTATAVAAQKGDLLKIKGAELRAMFDKDNRMAYHLMVQLMKVFSDRLYFTRVQLAAERG